MYYFGTRFFAYNIYELRDDRTLMADGAYGTGLGHPAGYDAAWNEWIKLSAVSIELISSPSCLHLNLRAMLQHGHQSNIGAQSLIRWAVGQGGAECRGVPSRYALGCASVSRRVGRH